MERQKSEISEALVKLFMLDLWAEKALMEQQKQVAEAAASK